MKAFTDKGRLSQLLVNTPVRIILESRTALIGAGRVCRGACSRADRHFAARREREVLARDMNRNARGPAARAGPLFAAPPCCVPILARTRADLQLS